MRFFLLSTKMIRCIIWRIPRFRVNFLFRCFTFIEKKSSTAALALEIVLRITTSIPHQWFTDQIRNLILKEHYNVLFVILRHCWGECQDFFSLAFKQKVSRFDDVVSELYQNGWLDSYDPSLLLSVLTNRSCKKTVDGVHVGHLEIFLPPGKSFHQVVKLLLTRCEKLDPRLLFWAVVRNDVKVCELLLNDQRIDPRFDHDICLLGIIEDDLVDLYRVFSLDDRVNFRCLIGYLVSRGNNQSAILGEMIKDPKINKNTILKAAIFYTNAEIVRRVLQTFEPGKSARKYAAKIYKKNLTPNAAEVLMILKSNRRSIRCHTAITQSG